MQFSYSLMCTLYFPPFPFFSSSSLLSHVALPCTMINDVKEVGGAKNFSPVVRRRREEKDHLKSAKEGVSGSRAGGGKDVKVAVSKFERI